MLAAPSPRLSRRSACTALLAVAAAACSRVAYFAVNAPAVFGHFERRHDLAYGADPQQRLDLYVPEGPAPARPLIVFWHGGRWSYGDKSDYRFVGAALAQAGYVTAVANYRHFPQVKMPGFMDDAARAASWAVAHAGEFDADPRRLYLMGHSAGAHMAALLALDPRYFAARGQRLPHLAGVIGLSGAYDFLPLEEADLQAMFGPPERYADSQPINFVSTGAPPMLLVDGLKDHTVAPKNTINFAAALRAHGAAVTLRLYPKLGHADTVAALSVPARGRAPVLADIEAFVVPPASRGAPGIA
jgi:acetyl esterase/lipase